MLNPLYARQFEKDLKKMLKRGKTGESIRQVIQKLVQEEPLEPRHRDHKLLGNYKGRRECHIEPDWLLIYKTTAEEIIFERTGTHSDLFE
ncbi:type II toxin-antitoxin system YafQ family toxin [cf. Phormidesmis sp. LEGE 11477]|uniref:type II toxin-antitoxin system RelE/ParE family toxin n=1 Tax=cf. Phormidesmis sp. LEGE 11477 TaxID=1828680 RepID=UPI00187FDEBE|nr:type II toxin-antitoxin system YafQ family toxin [cf. Phormidesmis sp. LEGE 11477]MBE9064496.1 type II toxin-antitoxin system YafQ family toxin [cf. Phormidesmis sp. LEGE 11477]